MDGADVVVSVEGSAVRREVGRSVAETVGGRVSDNRGGTRVIGGKRLAGEEEGAGGIVGVGGGECARDNLGMFVSIGGPGGG